MSPRCSQPGATFVSSPTGIPAWPLGIGAAALFSLVNTVVLKLLAYREPGHLLFIREVVKPLVMRSRLELDGWCVAEAANGEEHGGVRVHLPPAAQ
jgi:hypothetical protein